MAKAAFLTGGVVLLDEARVDEDAQQQIHAVLYAMRREGGGTG